MPEYNASAANKPNLNSGYGASVWAAEGPTKGSPPLGDESQAISLPRHPHLPNCVSVQVEFSGAPGAFQLDLQVADTDEDKHYVQAATMNAVNAVHCGRMTASVIAKYARLKMVSLSNDVTVTAKIF